MFLHKHQAGVDTSCSTTEGNYLKLCNLRITHGTAKRTGVMLTRKPKQLLPRSQIMNRQHLSYASRARLTASIPPVLQKLHPVLLLSSVQKRKPRYRGLLEEFL
ncbi:unnamed protein product [Amoebophrya sp. A120]|nr:unnamed protein product [Amoebophrya sp. A120]|eukprot:GSA120T00007335001.1